MKRIYGVRVESEIWEFLKERGSEWVREQLERLVFAELEKENKALPVSILSRQIQDLNKQIAAFKRDPVYQGAKEELSDLKEKFTRAGEYLRRVIAVMKANPSFEARVAFLELENGKMAHPIDPEALFLLQNRISPERERREDEIFANLLERLKSKDIVSAQDIITESEALLLEMKGRIEKLEGEIRAFEKEIERLEQEKQGLRDRLSQLGRA